MPKEIISRNFEDDPDRVSQELSAQMGKIWPAGMLDDMIIVDFDTPVGLDEETIRLYANPN